MKAEKREYEGEDQVEEEEEEEEEDEGLMELLLSSPSPCSSYSSSMFCYSGRAQEAAQRPSDSSLSALSSSPSSNSATACSQASLKEEEINGGMRSSSGSKREKRGGTGSNKGTIKARKERLGERIAVLQQLVSPFGKSDTASVLNEVLAYIRFLHEQVEVLSSPYLLQRLPSSSYLQGKKVKVEKKLGDLQSRGLCLVPLSCTTHVANTNGADLWVPTNSSHTTLAIGSALHPSW